MPTLSTLVKTGTAVTVTFGGRSRAAKGIGLVMRVRGMEQELTEFAEFYESTREDCLRIVLLNVGDRHLAQDLVAQAYTRAWVSWRKVRALEVPRAWVVRIALNTHVSWWRRRRREVALGDHDTAMPAEQVTVVSGGLAVRNGAAELALLRSRALAFGRRR